MRLTDRHIWIVALTGLVMGILGVLLSMWGNPENSGICVSCFMENTAGALGLHDNARLQYLRPELPGFAAGALLSALIAREFRPRGGSAPLLRLFSGIFLIVGCAIFIGCPIKLALRLSSGDLTAVSGVVGIVAGAWLGIRATTHGVELGEQRQETALSGAMMPAFFLLLLLFVFIRPAFVITSTEGSSIRHAPPLISLGSGVLLGILAQRSRFCITGSIRDILLMGRRAPQLVGLLLFIIAAVSISVGSGSFRLSLYGQPGAHLEHLWSFLGMLLVGWLSILIGGCPFRQVIKAGEGDSDAGLAVAGMLLGGALVQSWGIAATAAGVPLNGKIAILGGLAFLLLVSLLCRDRASR